jgi:hypothetical protein
LDGRDLVVYKLDSRKSLEDSLDISIHAKSRAFDLEDPSAFALGRIEGLELVAEEAMFPFDGAVAPKCGPSQNFGETCNDIGGRLAVLKFGADPWLDILDEDTDRLARRSIPTKETEHTVGCIGRNWETAVTWA